MRTFTGFEKGINLGGWISQCAEYSEKHYESFICEDDLKIIKSFGCDHVRLPVDYNVIMNDDGSFIDKGFTYIDNCILWAERAELNVILDLHKTLGYMFDTNAVANPDAFFHDKSLQNVFVRIWENFALRYGSKSDHVAFELLNEIVNPALEKEWNEIATRAFKAVRAIAPDSWIVVGGVDYNSVSAVSGIKIPFDNKTVLTFHCYEPLVFTHQKAPWVLDMPSDFEVSYPGPSIEYIREKSRMIPQACHGAIFAKNMDSLKLDDTFFTTLFAPALKKAEQLDLPLYCGEYGVIDRAPAEDSLRWYKDIHKALEAHKIGRALWSYKKMDFGIMDEHYSGIRDEVLLKYSHEF
ncbi:MAG: glycoside hydrolase family 5 protein [Treponema sp.]|nr:glycoside hydrolase family 5 protein [Treponema sp.]